MAYYNNSYAIKVNPRTPNLWGLESMHDQSGNAIDNTMGLGQIYDLDYDRDKIEQVFNQATDAQYALTKKENQIAQNQYANNMFANQQSAIETLRQQRNEQISSGMARGLNAAQEQGTILGLQQDATAGALELANQQQLAIDKVAAAYAENAISALQEANSVKQAMAGIAAQLYEADMLGYTGELSSMAQMDANASNRYGSELGYEGTKYAADMNYQAAIRAAEIQANAQTAAAQLSRYGSGSIQDNRSLLDKAIDNTKNGYYKDGNDFVSRVVNFLQTQDPNGFGAKDYNELWAWVDRYVVNNHNNIKNQTWEQWNKNRQTQAQQQTQQSQNTKVPSTGAWTQERIDILKAQGYTEQQIYEMMRQ